MTSIAFVLLVPFVFNFFIPYTQCQGCLDVETIDAAIWRCVCTWQISWAELVYSSLFWLFLFHPQSVLCINLRTVLAQASRFLFNHTVYLLVPGKYPQSHHADGIAIEVFPHVLAAFLIGSPALLTVLWVVVVVRRSLIKILHIFRLLLIHACAVQSLGTFVGSGGL